MTTPPDDGITDPDLWKNPSEAEREADYEDYLRSAAGIGDFDDCPTAEEVEEALKGKDFP